MQARDTTQAVNPYLPSYEYVPDGEPHVFGDRVYIYGSHDRFNGQEYCENDYVGWSAPLTNLANWRYEGVTYRKDQDPANPQGKHILPAPDVQQGPDGRYYLYYVLDMAGVVSVAVSDTPAGKYAFYSFVTYPDGTLLGKAKNDIYQFDPGVLVDDDKRVYLYSGFAPNGWLKTALNFLGTQGEGAVVAELESDMKTVKVAPKYVIPGKAQEQGTGFEGHGFYEASSMRKINGKYYFLYSSYLSHELCYAISTSPTEEFTYGGTIISNGDIGLPSSPDEKTARNYTGNNHGSLVNIQNKWFIFYHRQTNQQHFSRQGCAEEVKFLPGGRIPQVEVTSQGLNGKPLRGIGRYDARIACNLFSKDGAMMYELIPLHNKLAHHPYFTQDGADRNDQPNQYIANMQDGATAGFKYFDFKDATTLAVTTRGNGQGQMVVKDGVTGNVVAEIPVQPAGKLATTRAPLTITPGKHPLFFTFQGQGAVDFLRFKLLA